MTIKRGATRALACLAGSTIAFAFCHEGDALGRPRGSEIVPFLTLSLVALGVAAAFAPSWDSYVLQNSAGATEPLTARNVFATSAATRTQALFTARQLMA